MKRIESVTDFIQWAKEVNAGITEKRKCDMQDIYAHSSRNELDRFFIESEGDRKLIICSVNNVMAFDEVEHLLNQLARHKCNRQMEQEYKELDRREGALAARERAQQDSRKPYHKKLASLQKTITDLQQKNAELIARSERMRTERNAAQIDALNYEIKAQKYDAIKEALKEA